MSELKTIPVTWNESGYIHLKNFFNEQESFLIRQSVDEIIEWQDTPGKWMKYYEASTDQDKKILCRIENFLDYHKAFSELVLQKRIIDILEMLLGEPAVLFKEKINFKFQGGKGFAPHQDAPAWTSFNQDYHVTILIPIDEFSQKSGCLEIVENNNQKLLSMAEDKTIDPDLAATFEWKYLPCSTRDLVIFDSYLPHRSGVNISNHPRRGLYLTFNKKSAGDYRAAYYALKRKVFPQDCERLQGVTYEGGVFNVANPIM